MHCGREAGRKGQVEGRNGDAVGRNEREREEKREGEKGEGEKLEGDGRKEKYTPLYPRIIRNCSLLAGRANNYDDNTKSKVTSPLFPDEMVIMLHMRRPGPVSQSRVWACNFRADWSWPTSSYLWFKMDTCQLLAKVCALSTGQPLRVVRLHRNDQKERK